jgi:hypothetical protein
MVVAVPAFMEVRHMAIEFLCQLLTFLQQWARDRQITATLTKFEAVVRILVNHDYPHV